MKRPGLLAVLRFRDPSGPVGRRRPVLLLAPVPGRGSAWLVCALTTHLHMAVEGFDEVIAADDADFRTSGLKIESVVRVGRLAVVEDERLEGSIGEISKERLERIRKQLADWIENPTLRV